MEKRPKMQVVLVGDNGRPKLLPISMATRLEELGFILVNDLCQKNERSNLYIFNVIYMWHAPCVITI